MANKISLIKVVTIISLIILFSSGYGQIPTNGLIGYWPFSGNADDYSGSGNDGIVHGATLTSDRFGIPNSAYHFNGISDYISCGFNNLPSGNSARTISFWILNDTYPTNNSFNAHQGVSYGLAATNSDNEIYFWRDGNNIDYLRYSGYNNDMDLTVMYNTHQWYNVVATYDGNLANLYFNNVLLGSNSFPNWNTVLDSVLFGTYPSHLNYHEGKIDDVLIYDRALSSMGVDSIFNGTIPTADDTPVLDDYINIYPNPCKDFITINCDNSLIRNGCLITVIDSYGQTVLTNSIDSKILRMNISSLKSDGIYFVYVVDKKGKSNYISRITVL